MCYLWKLFNLIKLKISNSFCIWIRLKQIQFELGCLDVQTCIIHLKLTVCDQSNLLVLKTSLDISTESETTFSTRISFGLVYDKL